MHVAQEWVGSNRIVGQKGRPIDLESCSLCDEIVATIRSQGLARPKH